MLNIFGILKERGLLDSLTSDEVLEWGEHPIKVYAGFDPTAESLHIGNLVGIVVLAWFQKCGHKPYALIGGATGMIGDPSGKSSERNLLDSKTIEKNIQGIKKSLSTLLDFQNGAELVNNYDWFKGISFLDFLRDTGKYFRLSTMLAKESVKTRLASEEGISYTEFSYQLLQAYDFLHLSDTQGINFQIGGTDQWGNITAGTELVRKVRSKSVFGLTFPLLTRSDGKKFGKSEEGTIWLNSDKLSAYDFYQYFYRIPDADVIKLLRMLTFIDLKEIADIENEMKKPVPIHPNFAQKRLAVELTRMIHGEEGLNQALDITKQAQPGAKTRLDLQTLEELSKELPTHLIALKAILGAKLVDILALLTILQSKGEARRLISSGGLYLNNEKVEDEQYIFKTEDIISEKFLLLGLGKKKKILIKIG